MMAMRELYPEEIAVLNLIEDMFGHKLSDEDRKTVLATIDKHSPRKALEEANRKRFRVDNALNKACRELPIEWLLTHEDELIQAEGKQAKEAFEAAEKVSKEITDSCTTLNQVINRWKKYNADNPQARAYP